MQLTIPIESETLRPEEVEEITGRSHRGPQKEWLTVNGWIYSVNATGTPIVGRFYARMKLAGIDVSTTVPTAGLLGLPNFDKVR